jgi:UDP-N-acetylglucosamine acyltransferase
VNSIHPTALIDGDVVLGTGNTIGPHVVITGPVVIGDDNWFGTGVVVGAPPEVRSWQHPEDAERRESGNGITIGDRNVLREYVQVHQGWKARTRVGNDAFIMNQCYLAHDSAVDDGATLASSVLLAGHVLIGSGANLGLGTTVHQFRTVGRGAMVGMSSAVTRDIPPFAKAYGNPSVVRGANVIGMERSGVDGAVIAALTAVYAGHSTDASTIADDDMRAAVEAWIAARADRGASE